MTIKPSDFYFIREIDVADTYRLTISPPSPTTTFSEPDEIKSFWQSDNPLRGMHHA